MSQDDSVQIRNAVAMSKNLLISREQAQFRPVSSLDKVPFEIPGQGDCIFYINTMSRPVTVLDRDGIMHVCKPDRPNPMQSFDSDDLRALHPDSLIIIRSTAHDLSAFDSSVSEQRNSDAALNELETLRNIHRPLSDFESCYTNANRAFRKALKEQGPSARMDRYSAGLSQFEDLGRVVLIVTAVVKEADLHTELGSYIEAADIVVRKESYEPDDGRRKRMRINTRPIIHPFSLIGVAYNAEGGMDARDSNVYYRMVRAVRAEKIARSDFAYIATFNSVSRIPIQTPINDEDDGVYVTEKDVDGILRETRYSFEDAKSIGVFEYMAEATAEHQLIAKKYISDAQALEMAQMEKDAKERARQEQERKMEAQRKSDVIRYVSQVVAGIAALVTAAVTLIKIFAPSKFSFR